VDLAVRSFVRKCVARKHFGTNIVVGIDPGMSGAIALTSFKNRVDPVVVDIPVDHITSESKRKGKKAKTTKGEYDYQGIVRMLDPLIDAKEDVDVEFVLERGQARPKDSAVTAYAIGMGFGIWHLYFASFGFRYILARPSVWKRKMGLTKKGKDASRVLAKQLFPSVADFLKFKSDDGRAEALLLAEFSRRVT
jgi:crossover junction endodeoxyribonuclease RuvC